MDDFQKLLLETFAEEVRETVQALEKALLELEEGATVEERSGPYATLARRAHNLKGAAGAAGITGVQSLSHAMEDALTQLRDLGEPPAPEVFDVLYVAVDTIRELASQQADQPATEIENQLQGVLALQAAASGDVPSNPSLTSMPAVAPVPQPSGQTAALSGQSPAVSTQSPAVSTQSPAGSAQLPAASGHPGAVSGQTPALSATNVPVPPAPPQTPDIHPELPPITVPGVADLASLGALSRDRDSSEFPPIALDSGAHLAVQTEETPAVVISSTTIQPAQYAPPTPIAAAQTPPVSVSTPSAPPAPSSSTGGATGGGGSGTGGGGGGGGGGGAGGGAGPTPKPRRRRTQVGQSSKSSQPAARRTVRIAVDKLDALMNQIGEIITIRKKSQARLAEVSDLGEVVANATREFESMRKLVARSNERAGGDRDMVSDAFDGFEAHLADLQSRFLAFHRQSLQEAANESLLTERLPEDIKRLRMRPFQTLEDIMRRTVRDAARHCGKQIDLDLTGLESEADQVVLDVMRDPLMHLLRNCVDHGVEVPDDRVAQGKDPIGLVSVDVEARGATLYITVGDDGRGIDPEELKEAVRSRNLLPSSQLNAMTERELLDLIFLPGFSTAKQLGVISGRGIGMDVVREVVRQHHGTILVKTQRGAGTKFELTMPLTFATVQGIIVSVLGHDFALPMYALDRLIRLSRKDITYIEGTPTASIDGQPVSIVPLSEILEVPPDFSSPNETPEWEEEAYSEAMLYGAVVRVGDKRVAFLVDDFVGESEMVVKDIPRVLGRINNVSGTTITWSGEVMVILNPADLVDNALRKATGTVEHDWTMDALPSRRVLVCDDSVTTRTLEKNILAAAGYDVVTATNGLEALKIADEQSFQLVVLDVDMPEMTGFELASRLRMTPAYRDVPIILVTSRDTEEDKRRGLAAGADAYITKQGFSQRTFLETVRRFLA